MSWASWVSETWLGRWENEERKDTQIHVQNSWDQQANHIPQCIISACFLCPAQGGGASSLHRQSVSVDMGAVTIGGSKLGLLVFAHTWSVVHKLILEPEEGFPIASLTHGRYLSLTCCAHVSSTHSLRTLSILYLFRQGFLRSPQFLNSVCKYFCWEYLHLCSPGNWSIIFFYWWCWYCVRVMPAL